jgi:hypothetical protein
MRIKNGVNKLEEKLSFCAFVRMNLNSKEIAPLLNISWRGNGKVQGKKEIKNSGDELHNLFGKFI